MISKHGLAYISGATQLETMMSTNDLATVQNLHLLAGDLTDRNAPTHPLTPIARVAEGYTVHYANKMIRDYPVGATAAPTGMLAAASPSDGKLILYNITADRRLLRLRRDPASLIKASLLFALILFMFGWPRLGQAEDCRNTDKVVASAASVQANINLKGHVFMHVEGYKTEQGKTLFNSQNDFTSAFARWRTATGGRSGNPKPTTCGGGNSGDMDCVPAENLKITSARICTQVSAAGACTASKKIKPTRVAFRYAKNGKGSNGVWILNTAYPTANNNCS